MSVFKTDKAIYTPSDFGLWAKEQMLVLTPKFQRNPVWSPSARSFLIDTMLREMTVPPIYIRIKQNKGATKPLREVVDGQQRIRAVMDYVNDEFRLSRTLQAEWAGKSFSQLSHEEQVRIVNFGFSTEIFKGISDQQIYEVFCRLNMNGVALNKQELRNARFFGLFKQASYKLGLEHLEFWRKNAIFTENGIARMLEIQLTSELLIAAIDGMQDKKGSVNKFYKDYDSEFPSKARDEKRFLEVMGEISTIFEDRLADTEFKRPPLFYTLYCVVYHHHYGLPGIQRVSPKSKLTIEDRDSLKDAVFKLSHILAEAKRPTGSIPRKYVTFVKACSRQTDNIGPRKDRFNGLYDEAF